MPEIVPYVAICAFAGLRPSEAANLLWSDIHLDTMQIEVRARHSKTRRYRLVPIQPNLGEWLMRFRSDDGSVHYSRRKFREAYKAAGMHEWKMDILRHSYGTHRLPILKSADALALEMGNSPDVIFRHYRRPIRCSATNAAHAHGSRCVYDCVIDAAYEALAGNTRTNHRRNRSCVEWRLSPNSTNTSLFGQAPVRSRGVITVAPCGIRLATNAPLLAPRVMMIALRSPDLSMKRQNEAESSAGAFSRCYV